MVTFLNALAVVSAVVGAVVILAFFLGPWR